MSGYAELKWRIEALEKRVRELEIQIGLQNTAPTYSTPEQEKSNE